MKLKDINEWIENLSIGVGHGVTNQMEGLYQMVTQPRATLQGLYALGQQAVTDPRAFGGMAVNALAETGRRATSGPLGFGEVLGENLSPSMFRRAPNRNELIVYHGSPHRINNVPQPATKDYGISHRPMMDAGGASRLHDLTTSMGEDIYGKNALQYFGSGDPREARVLELMRRVRNDPTAEVTIYRGVPANAGDDINVGDWITLDPDVAREYADLASPGKAGKVISKKVKAIDVTASADSLLEQGYYPDPYGKFDLSKVGTGEGAQAYGYGIYLAENPGVARSYASDGGHSLLKSRMLRDKAKKLRESGTSDDIALAERLESQAASIGTGSNFYTVDLPDEHIAKMLDWDAPLSEQPEAVRKAVADLGITPESLGKVAADKVRKLAESEGIADWARRDLLADAARLESAKSIQQIGGTLKRMPLEYGITPDSGPFKAGAKDFLALVKATEYVPNMDTGGGAYGLLSALRGGDKAATDFLRPYGIPGIKYFDGGSRAAGEGTRNFVIFDGDYAKILKRE